MDIHSLLQELTLEEKASLCSGSDFWHSKAINRLGIPSVMMCDGPHGLRKQKGKGDHIGINESIETVCYPTASALASSFDRDVMARLGEVLGEECQAEDVGMLLGPGVNMKRSPLCGRNFEYLSEDPYLAGELASAYVQSLQEKGIAGCAKHYAVNNQETRRMSIDAVVDERTLHEIYLSAFETLVKKGKIRSIMCAYNSVNGTFCAENKVLLTDVLREQWGFNGFVVTDWGAVKDRVEGLKAGLDLDMPGGRDDNTKQIVNAVNNGTLDEAILDHAVLNMLTFINDYKEARQPATVIDRNACLVLASDIAAESAVLLKNEDVLPLTKAKKIAFIGEFAETPRFQGGGSSHINAISTSNALMAAYKHNIDITYSQGFVANDMERNATLEQAAVECAKKSDVAVVFAGLPDFIETEGADRDDLSMPNNQNKLIAAVAAAQPNTVVVLHTGSPVAMPWLDKVKAVLCMYLGGSGVGEATVRLLLGDENPSGKLAETWPLQSEDVPAFLNFPGEGDTVEYREGIYIGYRYYDKKKAEVLFPFGHGLSYTNFAYSGIKVDKKSMLDSEVIKVTCRVKNAGQSFGKEAVQLYVRDIDSSVGRPLRELRGFEKVSLAPGEEKEIQFTLDKRAFAYYEPKIHDWYVESGDFCIEIGASSRSIYLAETVSVQGTTTIPFVVTRNTTVGDIAKHPQGQQLIAQMMAQSQGSSSVNEQSAVDLGAGSSRMIENMKREMPLSALVGFGVMTEEQLQGILSMLNNNT